MVDILTKEQRSERMSLIRSKWTKQEKAFHNHLKGNKIHHKMHPRIEGSPDIVIPDRNIALFLHGCFWHGCKKCGHIPKSNKKYWSEKILKNKKRDKLKEKILKESGWDVITIWEHDILVKCSKEKTKESLRNITKKEKDLFNPRIR